MSFFRPLMAVAAIALATPAFAQVAAPTAPATTAPATSLAPATTAPAVKTASPTTTTAPMKSDAAAPKDKVAETTTKATKHHHGKAVKTVSAKTAMKSDAVAK